ncbi:MAG: winged helix DNA-binding protein [Solirubrobacterales bacterium]|nr:winged helix DNA-binding protein [Solirubrobacterales bacterium]MBV9368169.1 winged helix DNA-binding protein [Solirubrobacterales bacterium]MBV9809278.1 winged helix DNA-binding protein [Solirubrobacterales bacterium]
MIDTGAERWRRLTVKEGWRQFVGDEPTERPEAKRIGDYRRLDQRKRAAYDLERLRHAHGFGPIRSLYADVHRTLERLVVSNELRGPGARHGAALDGNPGNGKTTIVSHFGRQYERRCRDHWPQELTPDGHEYLPVVYVNVDALPTIKGLNHKVVDELERVDLVRRDPDPDDGRGVIVRYTDRGRAGLDIVRKRMLDLEAEFAERVGARRWADVRWVLETLVDDRA